MEHASEGEAINRALRAPLVEEVFATNSYIRQPDDIGLKPITTVDWRPLGHSDLIPSPWDHNQNDTYLPTQMSVNAMKIGLTKCHDPIINFPEDLVVKAEAYVESRLKSIWTRTPEQYVLSNDDAIDLLTMDKSPGFPYYFKYQTKEQAIIGSKESILEKVNNIMDGKRVQCIFSLTEKSELRPKQKVDEGKTRVFMASDLHHLIASKRLYERQNDDLCATIGKHPITIGVQLPGPQYINLMMSLGLNCNDGDVAGCDLRFNPRIARSIYRIRHQFLPLRYAEAGWWLYCCVYCGLGVALGALYRLYGNKSGWQNTGHDNSIQVWLCMLICCFALYPGRNPDEIFKIFINGDDVVQGQFIGEFKQFCDWLKNYGFYLEADNWKSRDVMDCVYLSHHLRPRFVHGFGDFICVAGNRNKLLSSMNWIKKSKTLSFEESAVAHLLGLRICLFPWQDDFEECDQILSTFLARIVHTMFIRRCLSARLSELRLAYLHTRNEGFNFFNFAKRVPSELVQYWLDYQVLDIRCSPDKESSTSCNTCSFENNYTTFQSMTKTNTAKGKKNGPKTARRKVIRVRRGLAKAGGSVQLVVAAPRSSAPAMPKVDVGVSRARRIGQLLGAGARGMFKAITGFGDYKVSNNSLMSGQIPVFTAGGNGTSIVFREYIGDITSSNLFAIQSYFLNPGNPAAFPWLSSIAQNYEEYEWRGIIFEFKSMSSELNTNAGTSSLGTVIMATQYNVLDPTFQNKRLMENYEFACSDRPSKSFIHPIECKRSANATQHLYVRTAAVPTSTIQGDLRLYDHGNFQIAQQGMTADFNDTSIGELWVSYHVELFKPKLEGVTGASILSDRFDFTGGTSNNPFLNSGANVTNTCGCVVGPNIISFPKTCFGRFHITIQSSSPTASTTTPINFGTFTNCQLPVSSIPIIAANTTVNNWSSIQTGSIGNVMLEFTLDVKLVDDDIPASLTFQFTSLQSNWSGVIRISQIPLDGFGYPVSFP